MRGTIVLTMILCGGAAACTLLTGASDLKAEKGEDGTSSGSSISTPPSGSSSSASSTSSSSASSGGTSGTTSSGGTTTSSSSSGNSKDGGGGTTTACADMVYGPKFPQSVNGQFWLSANAARADDGQIAHGDEGSEQIIATKFELGIKQGAQIRGIELKVAKSATSKVSDKVVRLSKGVSRAKTEEWFLDNSETKFPKTTYGGATDLWGAQWSASDFNDLQVVLSVTGGDAHIDSFAITVYTCE